MQSLSHLDRIRVIHLSSGHHAEDIRIFWKECLSLARVGYDVTFVVPGHLDVRREGVDIVAVKRRAGRLGRMRATIDIIVAGLRRNGLVYHFHDPELIPGGLLLRALGKRVIYDVHEDLPRDLLFKDWIPRGLRRSVSLAAGVAEWIAGRTLCIVAATPMIARRFPKKRAVLVQNFALKSEFAVDNDMPRRERRAVAYVGGITAVRCAVEMVEAIARVERFPDVRLLIAGPADPPTLVEELSALPGWSRVDYRGLQDRAGVRRLLAESRVGLVLFHPLHYVQSRPQPSKLYEYMAAGMAVIAADFPHFREVVEGNRCGLCVPPGDVAAITSAIEWMFEHPAEAKEMGRRGRELVMHSLNWEHEEQELLRFYGRVVGMA
jgi:glycosyltransferase involved in cell wall biosynthesis